MFVGKKTSYQHPKLEGLSKMKVYFVGMGHLFLQQHYNPTLGHAA